MTYFGMVATTNYVLFQFTDRKQHTFTCDIEDKGYNQTQELITTHPSLPV